MTRCALLVLAAGILLGADAPKEEKNEAVQNELIVLEGTWNVVEAERSGKKSPAEELEKAKPQLIFKGDKLTSKSLDSKGKEKEGPQSSVKLDPEKMPRTMDLVGFPKPGKTALAIYELKGDTLKICMGEERPKEFKGDGGAGLLILKRQK